VDLALGLTLWDSATSVRCAQIVQGRGSPATAVDIAGDGDNVVVGAEDGSCLLYNIKTAQVCVSAGC
jgi:WD40 repeat protein